MTFIISIALAAKLDKAGALAINTRPLSVREISGYTTLGEKRQESALRECVDVGFISRRSDGAFVVERFEEKAGDSSAERMRSLRSRKKALRNALRNGDVTGDAPSDVTGDGKSAHALRQSDALDKEEDRDTLSTVDKSPVESPPRSKKAPPDTAWIAPMVESAKLLGPKRLKHLTADERNVAARYFAYKFGNCTKTERTNISHATKVAAGIFTLQKSEEFGELTFAEYVAINIKVSERRDGTPFFDPWLFKSEAEYE